MTSSWYCCFLSLKFLKHCCCTFLIKRLLTKNYGRAVKSYDLGNYLILSSPHGMFQLYFFLFFSQLSTTFCNNIIWQLSHFYFQKFASILSCFSFMVRFNIVVSLLKLFYILEYIFCHFAILKTHTLLQLSYLLTAMYVFRTWKLKF